MDVKVMKFFKNLNKDARGEIREILDVGKIRLQTILYISTEKEAVRGNHYHKKDTHYTYLMSGKFVYSEKNARRNTAKAYSKIITPGMLVASHPFTIHAMKFLEKSEMVVFTTELRSQRNYERDTVRTAFI